MTGAGKDMFIFFFKTTAEAKEAPFEEALEEVDFSPECDEFPARIGGRCSPKPDWGKSR